MHRSDISLKGFVSFLYFAMLTGFVVIALIGLFNKSGAIYYFGTWYVTFPIGIKNNAIFGLVAKPYSLVTFAAFGVPFFFRYRRDPIAAFLMLVFSYCTWELVVSISGPAIRLLYSNTGGASLLIVEFWIALTFGIYLLVKPVINLNHWYTIFTLFFYVNITEIVNGTFWNVYNPALWNFAEFSTIIVWGTFILVIFRPRYNPNDHSFAENAIRYLSQWKEGIHFE